MRYPQKERHPSVDHDNIDLVLMGAIPYPEDGEPTRQESSAELLRFMDMWVRVQNLLQPPVLEDADGFDGRTGCRNILDEAGVQQALAFGLSANYGRLETHMRISAYLRRVYDESVRLEHYESEEVHLYSGDRYDVNENASRSADRIERLLGLYADTPELKETA